MVRVIAGTLVGGVAALAGVASAAPARTPVLPPAGRRVDALLRRLTLAEKVSLLYGADDPAPRGQAGYLPGVPRLGVPELRLADGPAGVRLAAPSTALPAPVALAAAFDPGLARRFGAALGREGRALGMDVLLAPMANIVRVPQAGRNFETLGEDPLLAAELVAAEVRGIQGEGLIATVKHYAANEFEAGRRTVDVRVDERTLREIHLPAFEAAVRAGVGAVMAAYPRVNGVHAAEHRMLLTEILRGEWGFEGWVMSDWHATHSAAAALAAGLDMEMPSGEHFARLPAEVAAGRVPERAVDAAVRRVLGQLDRFGLVGGGRPRPRRDPAAQARTAREVAVAGAVLLRNRDEVLPLGPADLASLAVIGPTAASLLVGGGGSARVVPAGTGRTEEGPPGSPPGTAGSSAAGSVTGTAGSPAGTVGSVAASPAEGTAGRAAEAIAGSAAEAAAGSTIESALRSTSGSAVGTALVTAVGSPLGGVVGSVLGGGVESPLRALRRRAGQGADIRYATGVDLEGVPVPASALSLRRSPGAGTAGPTGSAEATGPREPGDPTGSAEAAEPGEPGGPGEPGEPGGPAAPIDHTGARALPPGTSWTWTGAITAPETGDYDLRVQGAGGAPAFHGSITLTLDGERIAAAGALFGGNGSPVATSGGLLGAGARVRLRAGRPVPITVTAVGAPGTPLQVRLAWVTPSARCAALREAVALAREARTALVFAFDEGTEGSDRASLALPHDQDDLVRAVAAANPRTVVVLNTGGPVLMPWLDEVPTVLQMWYPGQEGGDATAALLLGAENPGGRLPVTFPRRPGDAPTASPERYPGVGGRAVYGEGVLVGYRHYDAHGIEPLFPFGHGLSYTRFAYSGLSVRRSGDGLAVSFTLANAGRRAGYEVAQVYLSAPPDPPVPMPPRRLAAFARVRLEPGERRRVTLAVARRALEYWAAGRGWVVAAGRRTVLVGASSRDLRLSRDVTVDAGSAAGTR
ncbi:glycoside hydrolase family 3 protein [Nonomuraea pusilla]|uniref:Beta-glucosidase n=1 Tax=Nonomuraea pusilla TaxID=46177 RepID=A0A1H8J333_9ACTN|nr:glycoside hydrolase family 3 N-terminal domain-containing protein [Nonomuraea pusilla]SEN74815.1 beta-glucosidase [Nonomuraea pusilla]